MSQHTDRPTVLYFVGKGRSGTTLIDNALGQVDGFVSTGEVNKLWTWGFQHGWSCGCGSPIPTCPFWNHVLEVGWADGTVPSTDDMVRLHDAVLRWPNVPRLLAQRGPAPTGWQALDELCDVQARLYRGIAEVSGASVIIDSSKWPAAPTALGLVPDVDVRLLHVVRDPRAVVASWKRVKAWTDRDSGESEMPRYGVLYSMASYWARNLVAEVLGLRDRRRHLRIRYEDLTADPAWGFGAIAEFCGRDAESVPVENGNEVQLGVSHTAGGNPNRLRTGPVSVRPDERWREELGQLDRGVASALGLPLMLRYGYPLR